jgi:hypothetical protein
MCLMWRRANRWPADIASDDAELLRLADRVKELDDRFHETCIMEPMG